MTPSAWGDAAQSRDAGHDEMQVAAYRMWRQRIANEYQVEVEEAYGGTKQYTARSVEVEHAFVVHGRPIGFADIAVHFSRPDGEKTNKWLILFWELKPRIYSIGSVIRQCRATELAAKSSLDAAWRGQYRRPDFRVVAVVYEDDPKAALLAELYPPTRRIGREGTP